MTVPGGVFVSVLALGYLAFGLRGFALRPETFARLLKRDMERFPGREPQVDGSVSPGDGVHDRRRGGIFLLSPFGSRVSSEWQ